MRYIFYTICLAWALYGVSKINGSHYIQQANQEASNNYFSSE